MSQQATNYSKICPYCGGANVTNALKHPDRPLVLFGSRGQQVKLSTGVVCVNCGSYWIKPQSAVGLVSAIAACVIILAIGLVMLVNRDAAEGFLMLGSVVSASAVLIGSAVSSVYLSSRKLQAAAIADPEVIRLHPTALQTLVQEFDGQVAATTAANRLKSAFPETENVYEPSGKYALSGLSWLIGGVVFGGVLGNLIGAGAALLLAFGYSVFSGLPVVGRVIQFVVGIAFYAIGGYFAGQVIGGASARARCRNLAVVIVSAIVSASLLIALNVVLYAVLSGTGWAWGYTAYFAFALLICALSATHSALGTFAAIRFCEDCESVMLQTELAKLSEQGIRQLKECIESRSDAALSGVLDSADARGSVGAAKLSWCPNCNRGFLDVLVRFVGQWKTFTGKINTLQREWLAASGPVTPAACESIQEIKRRRHPNPVKQGSARRAPQSSQASPADNHSHITQACPHCGAVLKIPREYIGQNGRCKHCDKTFRVNC